MKKIISLIVIIILGISFNCHAKVAEHIRFLGVPIGSKFNVFQKALYENNFKYESTSDPNTNKEIIWYSGQLLGENVQVGFMLSLKEVILVFVSFTNVDFSLKNPGATGFAKTISKYAEIRKYYTSIYGKPISLKPEMARVEGWGWAFGKEGIDLSLCENHTKGYITLSFHSY